MSATEQIAVAGPVERGVMRQPCQSPHGGFEHDWMAQEDAEGYFFACLRCEQTRQPEPGDHAEDYE